MTNRDTEGRVQDKAPVRNLIWLCAPLMLPRRRAGAPRNAIATSNVASHEIVVGDTAAAAYSNFHSNLPAEAGNRRWRIGSLPVDTNLYQFLPRPM